MADTAEHYANALKWIHHIAALHYMGGAFEPKHMRDLANIAADALDPTIRKELPDYEARMAKARERAREMADALGFELLDGTEDNDPDAGHPE
jgi:hypothetical protein